MLTEAETKANDAIQRAIIPLFERKGAEHEVRTVGWLHVAQAALEALRDLPIETRMEAVGIYKAHIIDYLEWTDD